MDDQQVDRNHIWHPFAPLIGEDPIHIDHGEGAYLYTSKGRKILDAISSWWVNLHGHANPEIARAIADQAMKLEQVIFAGFTHQPAIDLTRSLLRILPADQSRIFFSDDGSTSTEVALKLAIQYWHNKGQKRTKIIALDGAYHGDTFGAMSVGGRGMFTLPFFDHLFEVDFLPFPGDDPSLAIQRMQELSTKDVAAFIFEPLVQGAAGMRIYESETLDRLIEIARTHGIICIADEVMTGFGRTGRTFASDFLSNKPDIFCLSKGLTGGYLPMGITTANKQIVEAFESEDSAKTFFHGHSYTANPVACAAANASMKILLSAECQERIQRIAQAQLEFVKKLSGHPKLKQIKSQGTILSMELKTDDSGYASSLKSRIYSHFLEKDILLRPLGNVIYMIPPYVIGREDLERVHQEIEAFLEGL